MQYLFEILKDLRYSRVAFYVLLLWGGFYLAHGLLDWSRAWQLIIFSWAIVGACISCIVTNNRCDIRIDRIVNARRPLVAKTIPENTYRLIGRGAWLVTVLGTLPVFWPGSAVLAGFIANYYFYSVPPVRFKRVPVFSKLIISLNSILILWLGFMLGGGSWLNFPVNLFVYILVFVTLAANFIDIKDFKGDQAAGIMTLPVLLGEDRAKRLIGLFVILAHVFFGGMFGLGQHTWVLGLLGVVQYYWINRKPYDERRVFLTLFVSIVYAGLSLP